RSASGTSTLRLFSFFILLPFTPSRGPRADETDDVFLTFAKQDRQKSLPLRATEDNEALLTDRVTRIADDPAERIAKDHARLLEGDSVFREVALGLPRVPLKPQRHRSPGLHCPTASVLMRITRTLSSGRPPI